MGNTTGVFPLFREFKCHLKKEKKRLAPLQLVGKLENYLTKEFAGVILKESGGTVLPLSNYGLAKDGRRIDLVLLKGNLSKAVDMETWKIAKENLTIFAVVELKYVRNRHRISFAKANDETSTAFNSLAMHQLGKLPDDFSTFKVKLRSPKNEIYGLVFASYVCREEEGDAKAKEAEFIKDTTDGIRKKYGFQSHNSKKAGLKEVYSGVTVTALKGKYLVSLYAGLWRIER